MNYFFLAPLDAFFAGLAAGFLAAAFFAPALAIVLVSFHQIFVFTTRCCDIQRHCVQDYKAHNMLLL